MKISIIKPGLLSTIQDMGRLMYLSQAVPVSGAMDSLSARIANKAMGNEDNAAVIEFTYADAVFKTETDVLVAYAGDGAVLMAGDKNLPAERPLFIPSGTTVKLVNNPVGSRTYLAIAGGWDVAEVLGSKSTYITATIGGLNGRAFKTGDVLSGGENLSDTSKSILDKLKGNVIAYPDWGISRNSLLPANRKIIRVVPAHEFTWFDGAALVSFLSESFVLSMNSNRMGYHLQGAVMQRIKTDELLSTAVAPGTIQVTGNGSMVLLMADCQTTGGYPRIAQVAAVDMPLCGQLKPGDAIYFKKISRHEAEMLYIDTEQQLLKITSAVKSKI